MAQQVNGVTVGNKVRVNFLRTGTKKDGTPYQLFTFQESKYNNQTDKYDELGRYTIFVNNYTPALKDGDNVTIKNITKASISKNVKNNIEYINVNCWCEIEMGTIYQPRLVDDQQVQQPQLEPQMETPTFEDSIVSDDDLPF